MFDVLGRKHFFRPKVFWRYCAGSVFVLVMVATVARNQLADAVLEHVGSRILGNNLVVRQVRVGFDNVEITGLEVKEARLDNAPQLEIQRIRVSPTIWRGLCEGIWLRYLVVSEPTFHLRLDRDGRLLSHFPASSEHDSSQTLKLPFDRALVTNGSVVIHQEGKSAFSVTGANLTVTVDESIHLRGEIGDLLGTQMRIESCVDKSTFSGSTVVSLDPLPLDMKRLARLPLVPSEMTAYHVQGTVEARLQVEHLAGAFGFHDQVIDFRAKIEDVVSGECGLLTKGLELRAFHQDGRSALAVNGPIANGELHLSAEMDLAQEFPELIARFRLAGADVEPIAQMFDFELDVAAVAAAEGTARALWKDRILTFHAALTPILSDIQAKGISVADITTSIVCDGSYSPGRKQPLAGSLTIDTESEGVSLQTVARRFAIGRAEGQVGFQGSGRIPLATLTDLRTYNAKVSVHGRSLKCGDLVVRPLSLDARLGSGVINLSLPRATLVVERIADRPGDCLINKMQVAETLQVQSRLECSAALTRLRRPEAWTVAADVAVQGLAIADEPISDFKATCRVKDGIVSLSPCVIRWRDTFCKITGCGNLRDSVCASVNFTAEPIPLRHVANLASRFSRQPLPISGMARAAGTLELSLRQRKFAAAGKLMLADTWYGATRIGDAQLLWEADRNSARLRIVSDDFFAGNYVVDATLQSLDWTRTTVIASGKNIQLARLASAAGIELPVAGVIHGNVRFVSIGDLETLQGDCWIGTHGASIAGAPIQLQTTTLNMRGGLATLAIRGSAFDGWLNVDASSKLAELSDWIRHGPQQLERLPVFGRVLAKGIAVNQVIAEFDKKRSLAPLQGTVSVDCLRDRASVDKGQVGTIVCSVENVRWSQSQLSRQVQATAVLYPTQLKISKLQGHFADGMLFGEADLRLARTAAGRFRFNADRVNLRRALTPIPGMSRGVTGVVSVSMSGRIGSVSNAVAKVHASNITVGDLSIREIRLPIECSVQTQSSRVRWHCRGGAIRLGGGNVAITSEGSWGNGLASMSTNVNIRRVDSAKLLRRKSISAGIIDGNAHVQATRARAVKDLTGRFHFELTRIQSLEVPGFESFTKLAKIPTIAGPIVNQQDGGTINGRLGGGLLHLDSLALSQNGMLVLMDGTATLDGRLDLDATALTNQNGPADDLLALADSPVMLAVSAPVALVAKANEAMKDRVIHVHVGGTGARPTLRLQPVKNLSQDAVRFFIAGTLGNQAAKIAARQQRLPKR